MPPSSVPSPSTSGWGSLRELTPYHWFVFVVCCLAWDLDCMDQQLFVLARDPALRSLVGPEDQASVKTLGPYATAVFLIGWGIGGLGFGVLGDRIGRVKTLIATIFLYSLFTGLSAFSTGVYDFMLYRLLTGLGVGGAFAASVVLLAETVPERPRPYILGMYQASSVIGNCGAAFIGMYLSYLQKDNYFEGMYLTPWRIMFLIGIIPGLLLVIIQFGLKEPERWKAIRAEQLAGTRRSPVKIFFETMRDLLTHPQWGKRALLGLGLTSCGVIGLWGIGFFSPELTSAALTSSLQAEGYEGEALKGEVGKWRTITSLVQNLGSFFGIFAFSTITARIGRRPAFALFFVLAAITTAMTFLFLKEKSQIFWMIPIMGFCQLALFGGFAIYLPELFPTRYRSTGTSFCYNAGRFVAAGGVFFLGQLREFYSVPGDPSQDGQALRYAGVTMCSIFLLGLFIVKFIPETKGQPLPE